MAIERDALMAIVGRMSSGIYQQNDFVESHKIMNQMKMILKDFEEIAVNQTRQKSVLK